MARPSGRDLQCRRNGDRFPYRPLVKATAAAKFPKDFLPKKFRGKIAVLENGGTSVSKRNEEKKIKKVGTRGRDSTLKQQSSLLGTKGFWPTVGFGKKGWPMDKNHQFGEPRREKGALARNHSSMSRRRANRKKSLAGEKRNTLGPGKRRLGLIKLGRRLGAKKAIANGPAKGEKKKRPLRECKSGRKLPNAKEFARAEGKDQSVKKKTATVLKKRKKKPVKKNKKASPAAPRCVTKTGRLPARGTQFAGRKKEGVAAEKHGERFAP